MDFLNITTSGSIYLLSYNFYSLLFTRLINFLIQEYMKKLLKLNAVIIMKRKYKPIPMIRK